MSEFSFPFDSEVVDEVYDREYVADDFARYFRAFISSGVFMKASTNLQVIANGDMTVTLKAGNIIIEGYRYELTDDITITLDPADGVLSRIVRVALTWSRTDRAIIYTVRDSELSYNPVAPECRRNADYLDYVVADILVKAGVASIRQDAITDQRLNTTVCGVATPFTEIDTTTIFNQFESWLEATETSGEAALDKIQADFQQWISDTESSATADLDAYKLAFNTWIQTFKNSSIAEAEELFEELKDILDGAAAAHLQMEIDEHEDRLSLLERMVIKNRITAPISLGTEGDTLILLGDGDGNAIAADWKYDYQ